LKNKVILLLKNIFLDLPSWQDSSITGERAFWVECPCHYGRRIAKESLRAFDIKHAHLPEEDLWNEEDPQGKGCRCFCLLI
jgi:hypothetical protein